MKADLHMHSKYSDGILTNEELFDLAKLNKIDLICITNHDTLNGFLEIEELSKRKNLNVIFGLELSTFLKGESVHILGYFKNNDWRQTELIDFLIKLKQMRIERCIGICKNLYKYYKIKLDYQKLIESNEIITRGQIGTMLSDELKITKNEAFEKYLKEGSKCYIPSGNLSTEQGIKLLHDNNCLCVLAHPVLLKKNSVYDIIKLGIDGIEAIYPYNQKEETVEFLKIAHENNLFVTAGSDFHGAVDEKHNTIGYCHLEDKDINIVLEKLGIEL